MDRRWIVLVVAAVAIQSAQSADPFDTPDAIENYQRTAGEWLAAVDGHLNRLNHEHALLYWEANTNVTCSVQKALSESETYRSTWILSVCEAMKMLRSDLLHPSSRRMISRLCRGARMSEEQTRRWGDVTGRLRKIFSDASVTIGGRNYSGEDELARIMVEWRNEAILLQAWSGWRKAVGPPSKPLYRQMVDIGNAGARTAGAMWRDELEVDQLEPVVDNLYSQIEPFYRQLHAFVRGRLSEIYGGHLVPADQLIPSHLLGNMWAQNWEALLPHLIATTSGEPSITDILRQRNVTVRGMAAMAQDFYISLGFPPLPPSFWSRSQFVKPLGKSTVCHASAADLYRDNDVRLLMCAHVTEEDLMTLHHEMGHLYYYLTYAHQPQMFRAGANSAFHEAIGDTIVYGAMSAKHRQRMGFLTRRQHQDLKKLEIEDLLRHALAKIPLLPFSLVVEKWRWNVFAGRIKPDEYNEAWWKLKAIYQGVSAPVKRTEEDFDPAAKYHIIDNVPYIRYFLSGILQVQLFDAMCQASRQGPKYGQPLNQCDIYGSIPAGQRLRKMMSLGSSQPWNVALKVMTDGETSELSAQPLLDYYEPLHRWLVLENNRRNYTVGWPIP